MTPKEKILTKIGNLKRYVEYLHSHSSLTKSDLKKNYTLQSAIERNLQLAIETLFDIGEILISDLQLKKPESYREIILILGEAKIFPKSFVNRIAPIAGFRNILIHKYSEIDLDLLLSHLQDDLSDFDEFSHHVATYLKKK